MFNIIEVIEEEISEKIMNILYLITKSEAGGAQTHVYQLCKFFHKKDDITVVAYPGGWLEEKCKELDITFVANNYFSNSLNPFNVLKSYKQIKKIIADVQPDIVHCHSSVAGFLGRMAVRNKIPTLFTAHGWGFNIGVSFFQKWIAIISEKIVSKYTSNIICVSRFVKDLGIRYNIAPEEKFEVIYNGIELKVESRKPAVNSKIKIIFVGRLAEPKDPLMLVKAYKELSDKLKEKIEINIIGDGPKKNELELFLEENDLGQIHLLGSLPRNQVFDMMSTSHIFVLISKYEGLPMTILEAMSMGLAIIASDVGGIKEAVKDGENGVLLKNNSVEELKKALECLVTDHSFREKMGEASRKKVLEEFSLEKMLNENQKSYNKILKN
jgi:glycosyltransferase involved in cell wall biosynthesis